ncbi:MAG: hypothetical protein ACJ786_16495, partial [Catenulispora sp.]
TAQRRAGWSALGLFALAQAALMVVIRLWQPRFFYVDDLQAQYLPVWTWLGQRTGWSGPPLIDPDQGSGGAFVADLQYGVLDPFHWLLANAISRFDGLNAVGWGLHIGAVTVLGLGVVAVATHYRVRPGWTAAAALGAANCGFLFWFGASWWPAAWGTALLPWLWWALVSRLRIAVPVAAFAGYLIATSGYPYSLPFAGLLVIGVAVERGFRHGWRPGLRERGFLLRVLASGGGVLLAAPALLAASAMTPYSQRATLPTGDLGSTGDFIPNILDVLIGGPTSTAQVSGWWGTLLPSPAMATGWFVLPVLALVDWSRVRALGGARRLPGVAVSLVMVTGSLLASQTPTVVGGLRYPFRYVVVLQVVLPLLVALLASRGGVRLGRAQLLAASALLLVQGALGVLRTPALAGWHVGAAVLGILVLVVAGRLAAGRDGRAAGWTGDGVDGDADDLGGPVPRRRLSPGSSGSRVALVALVLAATAVAPLVSIGTAVAVNDRVAEKRGQAPSGL